MALSKVPPPGCSSEFSTRRERLGGHNCSFFPLQQSCARSLRVAWSTDGNVYDGCCLPKLISQIFPAIQSSVISLSIFYQFQNKLTTIATFFTWGKKAKLRNEGIPFCPCHLPQLQPAWSAVVGLLGHCWQYSCGFPLFFLFLNFFIFQKRPLIILKIVFVGPFSASHH